jgi:hypothetical protein
VSRAPLRLTLSSSSYFSIHGANLPPLWKRVDAPTLPRRNASTLTIGPDCGAGVPMAASGDGGSECNKTASALTTGE